MLAGKYLNSWETCGPRPEFDRWACVGAAAAFLVRLAQPLDQRGRNWVQRSGYQTDILADDVVHFIESTPDDQPFFAMYTPTSPHLPADDFRVRRTCPSRRRTVPRSIRTRSPRRAPCTRDGAPSRATRSTTRIAASRRCRMRSVRWMTVSATSSTTSAIARSDTLVIYLSDNGFLFGEHRRFGKTDAYEESVRVPMIVRYPAILDPSEASTSRALVSNIDIAPSIAATGRVPVERGRTIVRPARGRLRAQHALGPVDRALPGGERGNASVLRALVLRAPDESRSVPRCRDVALQVRAVRRRQSRAVRSPAGPGRAGEPRRFAAFRIERSPSLRAKLASLEAPAIDTTIVTGPWPTREGPSRSVAFTFFSPSRFSTYRCRLIRERGRGSVARL